MRKIMMLGAAIVFAACSRNPDTSDTAPERTESEIEQDTTTMTGQADTMPGQNAQTGDTLAPNAPEYGDTAAIRRNIPDTTGGAGAVTQPSDTGMQTPDTTGMQTPDTANVPPGDSALIEREVPDTSDGVEGSLGRWADSTKSAADSSR